MQTDVRTDARRRVWQFAGFVAVVAAIAAGSLRAEIPVSGEFIFEKAPFRSCHASANWQTERCWRRGSAAPTKGRVTWASG